MNERTRCKEIISILKQEKFINGITPDKVCRVFTKLGPTFVKLGQIMSSRYDVFPQKYCDALAKLRSDVEPMNFREVSEILDEELGGLNDIFRNISTKPIGSASIAQVHTATLITGEKVAIKIQRKNIYETMTVDVRIMKRVINLLHLNSVIKIMDLNTVIDEIYNVAKEEMDFELEAKHIEEFAENNADVVYVNVPKVYRGLVTKKVLVMEYIEGISLKDKQELIDQGYSLQEIGLKLANNYIKQALDDGFFHADPHQDNVSIYDGKIIFLDLGMMGRLNSRNKKILNDAMKAIVRNDVVELEDILLKVSTVTGQVNHVKLREEIQKVLDRNVNEDIQNIDIIEFTNSVSTILRKNNIKLDKNITLLMRGICVIEGTLESISPEINLLMVFNNKIKESALNEVFSKENIINTGRNFINGVNSLNQLPSELLGLVRDINRGNTKIDIEMANSDKQVNKLEKMLHQLIVGFIDGAILLGASFVKSDILRNIYLVLAILLSIWLLVQMIKDHFHNGY